MRLKMTAALLCIVSLITCLFSACSEKESVDDYAVLKMYYPIGGAVDDFDEVKKEINKYVKEKIHAYIEFETPEVSEYYASYSLKFQAAEPVDIMWINGSMLIEYMNINAFLELDALLEEYGQGIKKAISPTLLDGAKLNGHMYALPVNKEYAIGSALYYQKDLVDKYNLSVEEANTYEEVENIFKTIKDNESEIVPFYLSKNTEVPKFDIDGISNVKYENISGIPYILYDTEEDRFVNMYDTDYYRKRFDYIRNWYLKGYINSDASTTTASNAEAILSGKSWTEYVTSKAFTESALLKDYGREFVRGFQTPVTSGFSSMTGSMLAIPRTTQNPEAAMKLLNMLYTDEYLVNLFVYGIEGKHYIKNKDGKISMLDGISNRNLTGYNPSVSWRIGNQKLDYLYTDEPDNKWEVYDKYDRESIKLKLSGFVFNSSKIKLENTVLSNIISEYKVLLNTGSVDAKEALAELNKKLEDNGVDDVIKEIERQYEEWKSNN